MMAKLNVALVVVALFLGACTSDAGPGDTGTTSTAATSTTRGAQSSTTAGGGGVGQGAGAGVPAFAYALQQFDQCDALLTWIRAEAAELVGPYGFNNNFGYFPGERAIAVAEDDAGGGDGGSESFAAAEAAPASEFSTTNVQELGVDEPDLVKTDGDFLFVLADNELHLIDVRGDAELRDTMRFEDYYPNEILIGADRLYVLSNWYGPVLYAGEGGDAIVPEFEQPTLVITEVLVDGGRLTERGRLEVSGAYVTARQIGDGARIVVRHDPQVALPFLFPSSPEAEERAAEVNRQVVLDSTLEQWLPSYRLADGSEQSAGILPACDRVRAPQQFSGMSTVSVLTLDMTAPLSKGNALSLFGAGETVYASTSSLYAATMDYPDIVILEDGAVEQDDDFMTAIHQFDITDVAGAEYSASGAVPGHLLNQFSLSEHEGHLRVAVTEGSPWFCCSDEPSVSSVRILAAEDDELVEVGAVGDLGVDESIFGVRFVGDTGYVVTFRQTDPLYVIDLSNPAAPAVQGELKITGYSAYLHPVDDGLVLGVGQEATLDGATIGTKVSLFDVSDPSDPREIDRWVQEQSSSAVEYDHKAFLYWAPERLAVVPVDSWGADTSGAVALEVVDRSLVEVARIRQAPPVDQDLPPGCELVDTEIFLGTELEWLAYEGGLVVTCSEPQEPRSFGGYYCEPLDNFGIAEGSTSDEIDVEQTTVCWPENYDRGQIRRSVVIGEVVWTIGFRSVQANDINTFEVLDRIDL
ncbi:MAG TPA: beta-propeller domain-containing protein [Acidimicrobiia bacterium]|nr:beta-propeller domain-containing protein [Acidimicrobiia bacterium]